MKKILISIEAQEKQVAIVEDNSLKEFYVERTTIPRLAGNIYKGKVSSIVKGLGAAFVDLGLEKSGFLYVSDIIEPAVEYEEITELNVKFQSSKNKHKTQVKIEELLKLGQELLVQIVKEPTGKKGPRLTTNTALPGRYLVLKPSAGQFGISRRIENPHERDRLKQILREIRIPDNMGLIVRTVAEGASKRELLRDFKYLLRLWQKINARARRLQAPAIIHEEYGVVFRVIRDSFTQEVDNLIVDSKQEYKQIARFLNFLSSGLKSKIEFYRDDVPLFEKENIEKEIARIYERKIYLKKGGYIVIEQTEGMVAIDVNSGKFVGKKGLEDTIFKVNLNAAREVARQIRLRDLGGIIVIDFIDMKSADNRLRVFEELRRAMQEDRAKTNILSISELGLVEMTRQKIRKGLESVTYQECPYCHGRGNVKSAITVSIFVLRKINSTLKKIGTGKKILVRAHPEVASRLFNQDRNSITFLERKFRAKIDIQPESTFHLEQTDISVVQ